MIMATVGFLIMMYISKPFNKFKLGVLLINAIGLLLSIFFLISLNMSIQSPSSTLISCELEAHIWSHISGDEAATLVISRKLPAANCCICLSSSSCSDTSFTSAVDIRCGRWLMAATLLSWIVQSMIIGLAFISHTSALKRSSCSLVVFDVGVITQRAFFIIAEDELE